jgi:hypothetical protein
MKASGYESDLYEWTKAQADALRRRAADEVDWDNVADEIESFGSSQRKEIRSSLEALLIHLLKWRYDPDGQCSRWSMSISEARRWIELTVEDSPSLRAFPGEAMADAYELALFHKDARGLGAPEVCPWTIEAVLDADFLA